ncbi:MAG: hypothetical protein Q7V31_14720 [Parvibaculum sp.]|uniref:hypothetical protein n=1 Tax=Parvibaculum sp. TaxID=2024848 RepID=UPI00271E5C50|nr:hypothetical protein [Parvibaculum sp.]MDO8840170.1 hypothetical protein [Parvibaculum sp.]
MATTMQGGMPAAMEGRRFELRTFILVSILIHALLFFVMLLTVGGIFGGPGPGGGDSVTFQLSAGFANDRFAAPPEPVAEPEVPKPEPVAVPAPKPEAPPRRSEEAPPPEEEVEEVVNVAQAGGGVDTGQALGAGGDASETVLNRQGNSLSAGQIRAQVVGKTFHLEMGRLDQQGTNRLFNTVIQLNADGTTNLTLTQYFHRMYHSQGSGSRSRSGRGTWWIEGNQWCHSSSEIQYGTSDCYDMTMDGNIVRLYYAPCTGRSSQLCRTGRIAAEGEIR